MSAVRSDELRMLIREVIGEIAPQLQALTSSLPVSITDDVELASFVRRVVELVDSPLTGPLVRSGALAFRLQSGRPSSGVLSSPRPVAADTAGVGTAGVETIDVDRGVLSERIVARAVTSGARLVIGRGVVITPLAKEQIRRNSLDVVRLP